MKHIRDVTYREAYFKDIDTFMTHAKAVLLDEMYGINLEPDFLAYLQQNSGNVIPDNQPKAISTAVSATNIAADAGSVRTLIERINATISKNGPMVTIFSSVGCSICGRMRHYQAVRALFVERMTMTLGLLPDVRQLKKRLSQQPNIPWMPDA